MNNLTIQEFECRNCRYWIDAAIAAAAVIGSGIISAISQKKASNKAKKTSMELADYNTKLNEDMYLKYQSPSAQMAQYRMAGLNPNLIYGQTINGPSAGQADYSSEMAPNIGGTLAEGIKNAVLTYQNYSLNNARITQAEAVSRAQEAKAALDEARVTAQNIKNDFDQVANSYKLEGMTKDLAIQAIDLDVKKRYGALKAKAELEELIAKGDLTRQQKKNAEKQLEVYDQQIKESESRVRFAQQQIALGFGQLKLDIDRFRDSQAMNSFKKKMDFLDYSLRNRNMNLEQQKFQQKKMMDLASFGLNTRKFEHELQSGIMNAKLSPFPFIKGF